MAIFQNNLLAGAGAQSSGGATYTIDQSIRFPRASNTSGGYMEKTYSGAGDRTAYTWSCWFKLGQNNNMIAGSNLYYQFFGCETGTNDTNRTMILINNDSGASGEMQLRIQGHSTFYLMTTRKVRDPSAWYHLVVVWDTDNAISSERVRMYLNGERQTDFAQENYPSSGTEGGINQAAKHLIGSGWNIGGSAVNYLFDGYMAEIVFLDGTATDCNSFGEFNSSGIWIPKDVSGLTFGTNGFYIDGRDSSDLGDDESGRGNDYTVSGLAAHDQVLDTPTNNFCVLNPISKPAYGSYAVRNVTGTNLQVTENGDGAVQSYGFGTFVISSGKWYYEIYTNTLASNNAFSFGWIDAENAETATDSGTSWKLLGINQRSDYSIWQHGMNVSTATGGTPFSGNHTLGVLTDFDTNTMTITLDGSAYISKDFDTTSPTYLLSGVPHYPQQYHGADAASLCTFNFGQDSTFNGEISAGGNSDANGYGNFKYTVPTGALAICSRNLGS